MSLTDYFHFTMPEDGIRGISSLGLAHLGDAVYELMVRAWLCEHGSARSGQLHKAAVSYVSAPAQAAAMGRILPELTEDEAAAFRRGRNARVNSVPHGATLGEYHAATGLEALFGYLYLHGSTERLNQLFSLMMQKPEEC